MRNKLITAEIKVYVSVRLLGKSKGFFFFSYYIRSIKADKIAEYIFVQKKDIYSSWLDRNTIQF